MKSALEFFIPAQTYQTLSFQNINAVFFHCQPNWLSILCHCSSFLSGWHCVLLLWEGKQNYLLAQCNLIEPVLPEVFSTWSSIANSDQTLAGFISNKKPSIIIISNLCLKKPAPEKGPSTRILEILVHALFYTPPVQRRPLLGHAQCKWAENWKTAPHQWKQHKLS